MCTYLEINASREPLLIPLAKMCLVTPLPRGWAIYKVLLSPEAPCSEGFAPCTLSPSPFPSLACASFSAHPPLCCMRCLASLVRQCLYLAFPARLLSSPFPNPRLTSGLVHQFVGRVAGRGRAVINSLVSFACRTTRASPSTTKTPQAKPRTSTLLMSTSWAKSRFAFLARLSLLVWSCSATCGCVSADSSVC